MNKSSILVIMIPIVVIGMVLTGVFIFRTMERQQSSEATLTQQLASDVVPTLKGEVGKPKSGFSETITTTAVGDLSSDLNSITDDGGASDFSALEEQAAQL